MSAWPSLFVLSVAGILYIYLGYPLVIFIWARLAPRPVRKAPSEVSCSVVIVAHNEEGCIGQKLETVCGLSGNEAVLEILVGSDGSTDQTERRVREVMDPRVGCHAFSQRRGKPAVLNDLLEKARGDVVVFMDARQVLDVDCLRYLLENFSDPTVGTVSGELMFRMPDEPTATGEGMGAYWSYEKSIRRNEALVHSVPGATGALYAARRAYLQPMPEDLVLDDVYLPMQSVLAGNRCVFDERAIVYDEPSRSVGQEEARKRRTIGGVAQLLTRRPGWLLPWRNPIWFQYLSHKIARLASPFCLAGALFSSLVLAAESPLFVALALVQVLAYVLVGGAYRWGGDRAMPRWLSVLQLFVQLNLTTLWALRDYFSGRLRPDWQRTGS